MRFLKALPVVILLGAVPAGAAGQGHAPAPPAAQPHAAQPAPADPHAASPVATQPVDPHAAAPAGDHAADPEHPAAAAHEPKGMTITQQIARAINFAVLVGLLVYFVRRPLANYMVDRSQQIRHALVEAKATREQASIDLGRIEQRLAELPAELAALKARGADEVKAEQARIKATAAAERERLLEQTRREIDQRYRLAQRALVQETAEQAARIARRRLEQDITPADQTRLIDRYLSQVRA
jgi:F-type H+-transporting ATPase subunit b